MENKKLSLFYILNVLKEETDEEHLLSQQEIIDKIYSRYGLSLERKSVSSSLTLLEELGYDINKIHKKGTYLGQREFELSELNYLIDAVFSSKSISSDNAKSLVDKLMHFFSKYEKKEYLKVYTTSDLTRTNNKEVMLNIDVINEAIRTNKKISFEYLTYDMQGKLINKFGTYRYIFNPYYLFNSLGKYYVLGNIDKYDNKNNFRIEYIKNIKIEENSKRKQISSIPDFKDFKITDYLNNHIYLFNSVEIIKAKLKFLGDIKAINKTIFNLKDYFGNKVKIYNQNEEYFAELESDKLSLFYWLMQYGENLVVVSPTDFKSFILSNLEKIVENYKIN